jgi:hypothetical protein
VSLHNDRQNPRHPKTTFAGQLVCPLPNGLSRHMAAILGCTVGKLSLSVNVGKFPIPQQITGGIIHHLRRHDIICFKCYRHHVI